MSTYVVLPTYNEAANLPLIVPRLLALPFDLRIVVVDDASPDGSGTVADRLCLEHPGRIEVIHRPKKLGLGTAYVAGFRRALERGADGIVTMDADLAHAPEHIPAMLQRGMTTDLVIGSRYIAEGDSLDATAARRLVSQCANVAACLLLGFRARDVTGGFRWYRSTTLKVTPLDQMVASGYSFLIELLYVGQLQGWRVTEVPIRFHRRHHGESKISSAEVLEGLHTISRLLCRRLRGR